MFNKIKETVRNGAYMKEARNEVNAYTFKVEIKQDERGFSPFVNNRPIYRHNIQGWISYSKGSRNAGGNPWTTQEEAISVAHGYINEFKQERIDKLYHEKINTEIMKETGGSITYTA